FDLVVTIWMLEHVPDPVPVLREALRVVAADGFVECLEVDNASFRLDPPIPAISGWFERFNRVQQAGGGDPFVGPKLAAAAERAGAKTVGSTVARMIDSRARPDRRATWIGYLESLLLSGADMLVRAGEATRGDADELAAAFRELHARPEVDFRYFATRMRCSP
ncbi:methyltransferase domain-containing protein, partial [bacterium]|nr:methyltransferase domain-containing protein [bacterium]